MPTYLLNLIEHLKKNKKISAAWLIGSVSTGKK